MAVLTTQAFRRSSRGLRRGSLRWLLLLALLVTARPDTAAQSGVAQEFQIKAVFLYNFVRFVEWPPRAFADAQAPFVIGVLGDDPFEAALDDAVRDETVSGRPLVVRRFRRIEEVEVCHVLFVSRSETARLGQILTSLRGRSILTVGDADEFTRHGGMIRFVTENNKVRLRINVETARAAELTISSKLLRPAEIVTTTAND